MKLTTKTALAALVGITSFAVSSAVSAATVLPASATEIGTAGDQADANPVILTTDTVWTKEMSPIVLYDSVIVDGGASLTVEAGVVIVTFDPEGDEAGIVVSRDGQIFILGTQEEPVIATSANDVGTWVGTTGLVDTAGVAMSADDIQGLDGGAAPAAEKNVGGFTAMGDPKTGTWRLAATEWRNLTILGNGIISDNTSDPGAPERELVTGDAAAVQVPGLFADAPMEGLTFLSADQNTYGGLNDEDDSGTIRFFSSRYGGRLVGQNVELNGMSLGGVGKATDMEYIEIMNNTDDGIEIWGGTVDIKHFMIWNIGDDSFDLDQGWRGRAQFGLIVQGASNNSDSQGSGAGDNIFEIDGAEADEHNPRTTTTLYNVTVVGMPEFTTTYAAGAPGAFVANAGKKTDAMADLSEHARVQWRRCSFIDIGGVFMQLDDDYGNTVGALTAQSWQDVWTTDVSADPVADGSEGIFVAKGDFAPGGSKDIYGNYAQPAGKLMEVRDSVAYIAGTALDGANIPTGGFNASSIFTAASANNRIDFATTPGVAGPPITALQRETADLAVNGNVPRVTFIDPRPANDALTVRDAAIDPTPGGFFENTSFTGGFSPDHNWADGWSAADAFGFFPNDYTWLETSVDTAVLVSVLAWDSVLDVEYVIESSTDGRSWAVEAEVTGTGGVMAVSDAITVDGTKIYRINAQ